MSNQAPPRGNQRNSDATEDAEQRPMGQAVQAERPPDPRPVRYSVEFLVEVDGYHVLIRGEELKPGDMLAWTKRTAAALKQQGVVNVRRDAQVSVQVSNAGTSSAPAAANKPNAGSGEATVIQPDDGKPPRCSLHGAMVWREGISKEGSARAGQAYAFWGCRERSCRLTYHPSSRKEP